MSKLPFQVLLVLITNPLWAVDDLPDPKPVDAIQAILTAFERYPLVALGERHDTRQMHDFYIDLIRNHAFREKVDDIVFEVANARHQDLLDRFTGGEDVAMSQVRRVWRDATNSLLQGGDLPHYEAFLQAVREANAASPPSRRLRVLAGDPPLDWPGLEDPNDFWKFLGQRDRHYARIVKGQVLEKNRTALLIMGRSHLTRTLADGRRDNMVTLLEQANPGSLYIVHLLTKRGRKIQTKLIAWPTPAIAALAGTWLGASEPEFGHKRGGPFKPRFEQTIDAVLYLGPRNSLQSISPVPYEDEAFIAELERRKKILAGK